MFRKMFKKDVVKVDVVKTDAEKITDLLYEYRKLHPGSEKLSNVIFFSVEEFQNFCLGKTNCWFSSEVIKLTFLNLSASNFSVYQGRSTNVWYAYK